MNATTLASAPLLCAMKEGESHFLGLFFRKFSADGLHCSIPQFDKMVMPPSKFEPRSEFEIPGLSRVVWFQRDQSILNIGPSYPPIIGTILLRNTSLEESTMLINTNHLRLIIHGEALAKGPTS
ncbi:hypothetical protein TWF730_007865 [Orbilia blumenaviensis]|uniref:Uncharacterized protein n=1 Tax=Orbilia blumenaviensis TaxID=1796055 RepID=A0AAV9VCD2_9PEZI